ncbi:hypothetical protein F4861DRAFT_465459 [Xylaria intraflava]|nr:hypothetical protein F4861DRAFT_465459 [Xylaria intraflava]
MTDSTRRHRDPSPGAQRKRSHQSDDADERRVRRRSDDYGHNLGKPRGRSRSPHDLGGTHPHSRPRSSTHHHGNHHRSRHASAASRQAYEKPLPFNVRQLSRSADIDIFRPLFARYLDVQKRIDITTLDERELRGRWKSFVGKWNNAELAEGWYRPETFHDVMVDSWAAGNGLHGEQAQDTGDRPSSHERRSDCSVGKLGNTHDAMHGDGDHDADAKFRRREDTGSRSRNTEEEDEEDDDYGPTLPNQTGSNNTTTKSGSLWQTKHGPVIPTIADLTLRRELEASDLQDARDQLRRDRRADRALQKERLEDLAPRADAGSHARRLEKRQDARQANAAFAGARSANEVPEIADADLLGAEGGGVEEYRRMRREAERRKTEREVRREEILRARREEREERVREYRAREAHTVDMLREMARSRFGGSL